MRNNTTNGENFIVLFIDSEQIIFTLNKLYYNIICKISINNLSVLFCLKNGIDTLSCYLPSLSYNLKASLSSACMASASSSTINLDASVINSSNSNSPDPKILEILINLLQKRSVKFHLTISIYFCNNFIQNFLGYLDT